MQDAYETERQLLLQNFYIASTRLIRSGGLAAARDLSGMGVPYAMLLYERFLGRPFAGHRDSVSELIGDVLELAIETELSNAVSVSEKTRRAERIPGFDVKRQILSYQANSTPKW